MSKNTLEEILLCELEPVEIGDKILPGLICKAERTRAYGNIVQQYSIKFAHYPSEYYGTLYEGKKVPYLTTLEIIGKSKNNKNRLEITIYEINGDLELKKAEIIKERNNEIVDRRNILLKKETIREISDVSKSLMNSFYDYVLNNKTSGKVVSHIYRMNNIIGNILVEHVSHNFDKSLNKIGKYPSFYKKVKLFAPHPDILRLMDFYRK